MDTLKTPEDEPEVKGMLLTEYDETEVREIFRIEDERKL